MGFLKQHGYKVVFKGFALMALWFLIIINQNNFDVCESTKGIACKGQATIDDNVVTIPIDSECVDAKSNNCCVYIYDGNPQCYLSSVRQSVYAGMMGSLLILFAEIFYLIAFLIFWAFPFLVRFINYGGSTSNDPGEAALMTTEVFSKAIYLITPILLMMIFYTLYQNLPYFL